MIIGTTTHFIVVHFACFFSTYEIIVVNILIIFWFWPLLWSRFRKANKLFSFLLRRSSRIAYGKIRKLNFIFLSFKIKESRCFTVVIKKVE